MAGTAQDKLYGVAEGLWEPDLVSSNSVEIPSIRLTHTVQEPEDLFETISQTLLNAVDRDALSGWGAIVHVMWVDLISIRKESLTLLQNSGQSHHSDSEITNGLGDPNLRWSKPR